MEKRTQIHSKFVDLTRVVGETDVMVGPEVPALPIIINGLVWLTQ